jgi:hypothetical protein
MKYVAQARRNRVHERTNSPDFFSRRSNLSRVWARAAPSRAPPPTSCQLRGRHLRRLELDQISGGHARERCVSYLGRGLGIERNRVGGMESDMRPRAQNNPIDLLMLLGAATRGVLPYLTAYGS